MKNNKIFYCIISICISAILLTSCRGAADLSSPDSILSQPDSQDVSSESETGEVSYHVSGGAFEIIVNGSDNMTPCLNDGISLTIGASITADVYDDPMPDAIPADIYIFCNGRIIKHSENENEEPHEKTRHYFQYTSGSSPSGFIRTEIPVYIPPTSIGDADEAVLWVFVNYAPEYIPKNDPHNCELNYITVSSSGEADSEASVYEAQDSDYTSDDRMIIYDAFGYENKVYESADFLGIFADIGIAKNESSYSVIAYSKEPGDSYVTVFRNGELINAFDGKQFLKMNCNEGKQTVKYALDLSDMSEAEQCSYQIVVMPTTLETLDYGKFIMGAFSRKRLVVN